MGNHQKCFALSLAEPAFYILLNLALGKKHGYAILEDVAALSDGKINLSTSTLYGALGRLLDQELIERVANDAEEGSLFCCPLAWELGQWFSTLVLPLRRLCAPV